MSAPRTTLAWHVEQRGRKALVLCPPCFGTYVSDRTLCAGDVSALDRYDVEPGETCAHCDAPLRPPPPPPTWTDWRDAQDDLAVHEDR